VLLDRPAESGPSETEACETGEIGGTCEEAEVGVDLGRAGARGLAVSVSAVDEMTIFARPSVGWRVVVRASVFGLARSGAAESLLVGTDPMVRPP